MKIESYEYNEDVVGYVITVDDGRTINAQFEKCRHTNHPKPGYMLYVACEGDDTFRAFSEKEREEIMKFIRSNEEMDRLENLYTKAVYNNSGIQNRYPLYKWEIEELAEQADD